MVSVKMVIFFVTRWWRASANSPFDFPLNPSAFLLSFHRSDLKLMWKTKHHEGFLSSEYDIASQASFRSSQDNVNLNIKKQNI